MGKLCQTIPVFIVGAPRSGTTLLAAMLGAHSKLSCGNETHFFEGLTSAVVECLTDSREWPLPACDYVSRLRHVGRTVFELYEVDFKLYRDALACERPSISAILSVFMTTNSARTGKWRWVEKTPGHLKCFARIREHYPDSPLVCILRDPRAVAISLTKTPWGASNFSDGLLVWKSYLEHYKRFIINQRNLLTITFEDLVRNPIETSRQVCSFIKEDYDPGMLDTSISAERVGGTLEPYKQNVTKAPDPARAFAWRKDLSEHDLKLADSMLGGDLIWLGYGLSHQDGVSANAGPLAVNVRPY